MHTFSFKQIFSLGFVLAVALLFAVTLQAWTGPTATAPNGNVAAPLNVGTTDQVKSAGISVNALTVFGSQYIQNKLGINVTNPLVALDVNGTLKIANGGELCQAISAGAIRFNNATSKLEYCDGSDWYAISGTITTVSSGSQTFTSSGVFNVPNYNSLSVTVKGAGGGGGGAACEGNACEPTAGTSATQTAFDSSTQLIANGGGGGGPSIFNPGSTGSAGSPGTASGGDTNTTGGGNTGGAGGWIGWGQLSPSIGGSGGAGGKSVKTWTVGASSAPVPGTGILVTIGSGGTGGTNGGGAGSNGSVTVTWQ